jgi:peptide/nickel transport system substrate-binding protein
MRRSTRGPGSAVLAVVALLAIAAGCGQASNPDSAAAPPGTVAQGGRADLTLQNEGAPRQGGKVVFGLAGETDGWNPATNRWGASGYIVGFSVFDPIAAYDDALVPRPYLARSITPDATFTTWTIELRSGVVFHDGTPVDAAAVATNLDAQRSGGLTAETLSFISTVEVTDTAHVKVTMSKPWSGFPNMLTSQVGAIASPAMLAGGTEASRHPVGSGPFRFVDWETDKHLNVTKNDRYWRAGYPHLDDLEFRPLPDGSARAAALRAGDVNIIESADPKVIRSFTEAAQQDPGGYQLFTDLKIDGPKIFLTLNHASPPFDDPVAREAVARAVDRNALSEVAFEGVFPPITGPFSESSPWVSADVAVPSFDTAKAKQLAQDYETKHGAPLTFSLSLPSTTESAQIGQTLQQQFADAGIKVDINGEDAVALIVDIFAGKYQAGLFSLFSSPVIDTNYAFIAGPAKPVGQLSLNFARVSETDNAALIAAMDKARSTADPAEQKAQYAIVQQEMAKNLGFVFLVRQTTAVIYDASVRGAKLYDLPGPDGEPVAHALARTAPFTFNLWVAE